MNNCIFCKIINGEAPADFVYKGENLVVFRNINPKAPIHLLIVPKKHYPTLNEVDDKELLGEMLARSVLLAKDLGLAENGYKVDINVGKDGGQIVRHLHFHLLGGWSNSGRRCSQK